MVWSQKCLGTSGTQVGLLYLIFLLSCSHRIISSNRSHIVKLPLSRVSGMARAVWV